MIATLKSWRFLFTTIAAGTVSFLGTGYLFGWKASLLTLAPTFIAAVAPHLVTAVFGPPPAPAKEPTAIPIVKP